MKKPLSLCFLVVSIACHAAVTGQLWYSVELGNTDDLVLGHINSDGSNPTYPLRGGSISRIDMAVDPAANLYWVIDPTTGSSFGTPSPDPTALSLIEYRLSDNTQLATLKIGDSADQDLVESMAIDPINHVLYVAEWGADQAHSGIEKVGYNPTTGAMTGGFSSPTFLVNNANYSGLDLALYMSIDLPNHKLYFVDNDNGYSISPYSPDNGVYVVDTATANPVPVRLTSINNVTGGFPPGPGVGEGGGTAATDDPNGLIASVAVNSANGLVYFTTAQFSEGGSSTSQDALWWVSTTGGAGQVATKVTLPSGVVLNYPGENCGLSFDSVGRQLFISDLDQLTAANSRILTCQLSADGKSITSVKTNGMVTLTGNSSPNQDAGPLGSTFLSLPIAAVAASANFTEGSPATLSPGMTVTSATDGYLQGATVAITSGLLTGDTLSAASIGSISVNYNSATGILTLANYDTLANYQAVLRSVAFNTTNKNPDNYGADTTRGLSWILNDGLPNIPAGAQNSSSSVINVTAVDNAPTNQVPGPQSVSQNVNLSIAGVSVKDLDADPASQNLTMTLAVSNGTVTILTSVSGGVTSGQVSGNGSATVTLTAPQTAINTTLAAGNSLVYKSAPTFSGSDTLTITTSDNGHTGTGGPLQDRDTVAIAVQGPAVFTSANSVTFTNHVAGTFQVAASGFPAPTLSEANTDTLPGNVTFNAGTGILGGTPSTAAGGVFTLNFKAHNGVGTDAAQVFTLTVLSPPAITCPADVLTNAAAGVCLAPSISFAANAAGYPAPSVIYTLNSATITSPFQFQVGASFVTTTAASSSGTNTCGFTVTVAPGPEPTLNIAKTATNAVVSWPTNYSCYRLQYVTNLSALNWSNYPGPFATNGANIVVSNNASVSNRFFRLTD